MKSVYFAAVLAMTVVVGPHAAAADTAANWLKGPTPEDLLSVWPRDAFKKGYGGKAIIACRVTVEGGLRGCTVESETPAGAGFGGAAIALTPQFLMKPAMRDGVPVVGDVRIPVIFPTPDPPTGSLLRGAGFYTNMARVSLSNVAWSAAPSYAQVAAAYPAKARQKQIGGRATLSCTFKAEGRIGSCDTVTEEPKGYGFASAAKSLAGSFVGPSTMTDGSSTVGLHMQIPFAFSVEMLAHDKRVMGKPQWLELPSGADFARTYPTAAVKAGVQGARVVMLCEVVAQGRLDACVVESEDPSALGFGQAGLALAGLFQVKTWTPEGLPTIGGKIRLPIRYQAPQPPASQ
jgi:TonB family protein